MALPGTDPVSMLLEMVPLLILFELSVLLARLVGRPPEPAGDPDPTGAA
jgi:Sec-independent protein secretion pathway component TatC